MIRMDVLGHSQDVFFVTLYFPPLLSAVAEGPRGYTELPAEQELADLSCPL